ncbi:MAG: OOP family OmpA-OmpF porin, partial [Paracoccaceae bacterium]
MTLHRLVFCVLCAVYAVLGAVAWAEDALSLPSGSRQLADRTSPLDSYALPVGAFDGDVVPVQVFEGRVERQTWQIDSASLTPLQVLAPLRDQIKEAGFDIVFACRDQSCGRFDFRFGTEVVPAPDMYVDIRNYRFLSALRGDDEALSLLISRSRSAVYVQVIRVGSEQKKPFIVRPRSRPDQTPPSPVASEGSGLAEALQSDGHVVLGDLVFPTGLSRLGAGPFATLTDLARFLTDNPSYKIALVGHTDSVGSLTENIALSKRRAQSVRERMTNLHGIASA